ncbi:MAG TPA: hypothetical protein VKP04_06290 [Ktedonobacteraceae bacterium]|nr:hypothetical protein [Ktedonobacteraceae bacterium]
MLTAHGALLAYNLYASDIENQINQGIDQVAGRIPGGQQYSQQAKDAAAGGLQGLEGEAEKRLREGGLGGLFGGNQGNQ